MYFKPDIVLSTLEEFIYNNDEPLDFTRKKNMIYFIKVIYQNDEAFVSLSIVSKYNILKRIKEEKDIVVVLCGQGGDETFMGYVKYFFF